MNAQDGCLVDAEPLSCGFDKRGFVPQRLQQAEDAVAVLGRADQHRADQPVAQLLGEIVEHLVARRRHVLEQLLHQLVVIIGELLQHGEARFLLARGERDRECRSPRSAHARDRRKARSSARSMKPVTMSFSQIGIWRSTSGLVAGRLQHRHDVAHARLGLVDLVDEQEMRDAAIFELLEDQLQRRNLLLVGLAHHHRGVAGGRARSPRRPETRSSPDNRGR